MGGRGAKSGVSGPVAALPPTPPPPPTPTRRKKQPAPTQKKSTVDQLNADYKANAKNVNQLNAPFGSSSNTELGALRGVYQEGYNDENNPQLVKWQGQTDQKSAAFMAKVHNMDYSQYQDKYGFYDGDYQKMTLALGLNKPPTVLSEKEFNAVVKQNNLQVLYRGEAGQGQCDRFMNAQYSHTGVGNFGDGFYFSQFKGVANSYASSKGGSSGRVLKMALSPKAKCITYDDLMRKWNALPASMKNALKKQGSSNSSWYSNRGQAQLALKLGYNVVTDVNGNDYHYGLTRDAFIVCETTKHHW